MLQYTNAKIKVQSIMLRLYQESKITKKQIEAEYQNLVISLLSENCKGIKYEISN